MCDIKHVTKAPPRSLKLCVWNWGQPTLVFTLCVPISKMPPRSAALFGPETKTTMKETRDIASGKCFVFIIDTQIGVVDRANMLGHKLPFLHQSLKVSKFS